MRLVNSSVMGSCMVGGAHNKVSEQLCDGFLHGGSTQ